MPRLSLRRYENQIRIFFILLVFTLLIITIMNFFLLSSSRTVLVTSEVERGRALSQSAFRELEQSGATQVLMGPGRLEFPVYSSYLRRWASRNGLLSGAILNAEGKIIVSSGNFQAMDLDPDFSGMDPESVKSLKSGLAASMAPDKGKVVYFFPVLSTEGKPSGFVKAVYFDTALQSEQKNYRILIYSQATVIIILLVLVILFGSWVMRPFRALEEAASRIPESIKKEWGWSEEPVLVEESFKKVLEKIVEQEEALHRLHSGAETLHEVENLDQNVEAFVEKVGREMASGVIYLSNDGRIITMNPEAVKIFGGSPAKLKGEPLSSASTHIDGLSDLIDSSIREGRKFSREVLKFSSPGGKRGHLGIAITPVRGEAGKVIGALCMLTDLTEIQNLQERGKMRENLAAVGAISAGIAHEFRNSLGAILANAKLIQRGKSLEESRDGATAILKEVDATRRVVDDFLSYARPAQLNRAQVDLKKILEELKNDLKNNEQFTALQIDLTGDTTEIPADEILLKQAFFNIIKNSAEAYGGGRGKISITLDPLQEKQENKVVISFSDHAGGVKDDQIEKIFIPFFSTKESGTGLGLAIAQKIVISHDGTIEAENRKGVGLTFRITLPRQG